MENIDITIKKEYIISFWLEKKMNTVTNNMEYKTNITFGKDTTKTLTITSLDLITYESFKKLFNDTTVTHISYSYPNNK